MCLEAANFADWLDGNVTCNFGKNCNGFFLPKKAGGKIYA
jgi:hypothetical protein